MNKPIDSKQTGSVPVDLFAEALVKVQGAIKTAVKDATNPAFRSKYADLGAVWEAVKPALQANGFVVVQSPNFEGDTMWLETTLLHVSGERMTGRYPLRPSKQDPQGFGSALTYARRYSLSSMLGVVADEDDDGNAASGPADKSALQTNVRPATMRAPQAAPTDGDEDVTEGVKNWVAQQKAIIDKAERLPDLYMWADENCLGGTPAEPDTASILYRLKKKAPDAFHEIVRYYQTKADALRKAP